MNAVVTALQTAVTNLTAIVTPAIALLNQLNTEIQAGNANGIDPVAVQTQIDAINALAAQLQATVTADTPVPAAPTPPVDSTPATPST